MIHPGYVLKNTYIVDELHARGGMALVYRVHHKELGVTRALKVLQAQFAHDANFVQRFRREAQIMAHLRHPNIAEVYDFGTTSEGWLYLVMEWLDGEDLQSRLSRMPQQPSGTVASLSRQIAGALMTAHEAGVIHRDLKPANILLCRGPSGEQLKVVDFGIARFRSNEVPETLPGVVMGTPGYMAPEQLLGQIDQIDAHSDQFSLAVMLYEMLLGQRLFRSQGIGVDELFALALRITQLELPPLPIENATIRSQVEKVLRRAMSPAPSLRYPTIAEFDEAFRDALADSARTPSVSVELMATSPQHLPRKHRLLWFSVAAIAVTVAATTTVTVHLAKLGERSSARRSVPTDEPIKTIGQPTIPAVTPPPSWHSVVTSPAVKHPLTADIPTQTNVQPSIQATSPSPASHAEATPLTVNRRPASPGAPPVCKRTASTAINVFDEPLPTNAIARGAQSIVRQCLKKANLSLASNSVLVLERTNNLHVMSAMDMLDKKLLESCLQTKFPHRPPRRIVVKRTVISEGACNGP